MYSIIGTGKKAVTYLLEDLYKGPVDEVAQEELVTTGYRSSEVSERERRSVVLGVPPTVGACDNDCNHV